MGWSSGFDSRQEVVDSIMRDMNYTSSEGVEQRAVVHSMRGNTLWAVIEKKHPPKEGQDQPMIIRMVLCVLLEKHMYRGKPDWGYKPMGEDEGPVYFSCPLSYLALCTEPVNDYSRAWRERVRSHHANLVLRKTAHKQLQPGWTFQLSPGYRPQGVFTVSTLGKYPKGSGISAIGPDGSLYRISSKHIDPVTVKPPTTTGAAS